ncbi:hypothetical protein NDN01_10115 [Sphingomonas sp. QA11]|uniref:hypothetical protein n=1 Tax=Sphingomonas sp. QA11 TaxID=2950605 RepID=UPI00234AF06B|nr:hypothetical protein [Sphingomonas sp. QA11]WCM29209.1 hypothetical protein NDN01_10115 [Sphingomonas sp. QA11]
MAKVKSDDTEGPEAKRDVCGIIMPIAAMPGYDAEHWREVMDIIGRGIERAGRRPEPVWGGGATDIIQDRIVRNLYEQPIAVCDISGLNSNVMLELGIRLAFGKPTIIVTDRREKVPFDIHIIEYLEYPADLHILKTEKFIADLGEKIRLIMAEEKLEKYRPFIKTFGPIEPGSPGSDAIPFQKAILDQIGQLGAAVRRLESRSDGRLSERIFVSDSEDLEVIALDEFMEFRRVLDKDISPEIIEDIRGFGCVYSVDVSSDSLRVKLHGPRELLRFAVKEIERLIS